MAEVEAKSFVIFSFYYARDWFVAQDRRSRVNDGPATRLRICGNFEEAPIL